MIAIKKVALISDSLTEYSLHEESIDLFMLSKLWSDFKLSQYKPDILLVESAWLGNNSAWKYKIASYPDVPKRNNNKLVKLINVCKERGIPTVFWNKEDGVHFDRFIDSAKHFDHILTVDENCIPRYRAVVPDTTTVDVAPFCVQPKFHNYQGFHFKHHAANFVGSFSSHIHDKRRDWQNMLFESARDSGLPLTVFDRNSERKSSVYRYPKDDFDFQVLPSVSYPETASIYRDYLVSLNVNTIEDSATMYSRRVVEVLACAGILVSTPSLSMERLFKDYCHIVNSKDETVELFSRLKYGPSKIDLERARAGSDFVLNHFTWRHFLERIQTIIAK